MAFMNNPSSQPQNIISSSKYCPVYHHPEQWAIAPEKV
jgi:hypothetical protein